jgi:hypothetical protein
VVFPDGIPEELHETPINIDLTPVVKGEKGDGRVLVRPRLSPTECPHVNHLKVVACDLPP